MQAGGAPRRGVTCGRTPCPGVRAWRMRMDGVHCSSLEWPKARGPSLPQEMVESVPTIYSGLPGTCVPRENVLWNVLGPGRADLVWCVPMHAGSDDLRRQEAACEAGEQLGAGGRWEGIRLTTLPALSRLSCDVANRVGQQEGCMHKAILPGTWVAPSAGKGVPRATPSPGCIAELGACSPQALGLLRACPRQTGMARLNSMP